MVANFLDWGGFLDWYGKPRIQAVIDDRTGVNGEQLYRDYLSNLRRGGRFAPLLQNWGADYLLWPVKQDFASYLLAQRCYPVAYQDDLAVVFEIRRAAVFPGGAGLADCLLPSP